MENYRGWREHGRIIQAQTTIQDLYVRCSWPGWRKLNASFSALTAIWEAMIRNLARAARPPNRSKVDLDLRFQWRAIPNSYFSKLAHHNSAQLIHSRSDGLKFGDYRSDRYSDGFLTSIGLAAIAM